MVNDGGQIEGNIYSFGDESTQNIFNNNPAPDSSVPDELHTTAKQVMDELDSADSWQDLQRHDLTSLSGQPGNWYELDINDQYRIYFEWDSDKGACRVQADDHL